MSVQRVATVVSPAWRNCRQHHDEQGTDRHHRGKGARNGSQLLSLPSGLHIWRDGVRRPGICRSCWRREVGTSLPDELVVPGRLPERRRSQSARDKLRAIFDADRTGQRNARADTSVVATGSCSGAKLQRDRDRRRPVACEAGGRARVERPPPCAPRDTQSSAVTRSRTDRRRQSRGGGAGVERRLVGQHPERLAVARIVLIGFLRPQEQPQARARVAAAFTACHAERRGRPCGTVVRRYGLNRSPGRANVGVVQQLRLRLPMRRPRRRLRRRPVPHRSGRRRRCSIRSVSSWLCPLLDVVIGRRSVSPPADERPGRVSRCARRPIERLLFVARRCGAHASGATIGGEAARVCASRHRLYLAEGLLTLVKGHIFAMMCEA